MAGEPYGSARTFVKANFTPSFVYPLKGIWYFATHRYLHPLARTRLLPLTLLSICVLALLFVTTYLPIVAFLAIFHVNRGSAWVNGTFFILGIGTLLISILFEALFVDNTQVDIFDAVLVGEGYEHLVRRRRPVSEDIDESDPVKRLGAREKGAKFAPFSFRQILEFALLLPLTFIPFVGVPLFLLGTGYRAGPLLNWRYYALKGFTRKERKEFIKTKQRRWEYMWFGSVYMLLQLIPGLSMLFLLTSATGSALWSVHIEHESADSLAIEQNEHEDLRPEYTDDPKVVSWYLSTGLRRQIAAIYSPQADHVHQGLSQDVPMPILTDLTVLLLWYDVKYLLQRRRQTPYQRGLYERLVYDLEEQNPILWSREGASKLVEPQGTISEMKWYLLKRWFAPDKTIDKKLFCTLDRGGDADLGAWDRINRRLLLRWLATIRLEYKPGDNVPMSELTDQDGNDPQQVSSAPPSLLHYLPETINALARFTTRVAIADAERSAVQQMATAGLKPMGLQGRHGSGGKRPSSAPTSPRRSQELQRPGSRGSGGVMVEEKNLSDSVSDVGGGAESVQRNEPCTARP